MARRVEKPSVSKSVNHDAAEQAVLDALTVREAVFALGDDDLVLLADALLHGIAEAARRARPAPASARPHQALSAVA